MTPKKVLVTGALGLIGGIVYDLLTLQGVDVTGLDKNIYDIDTSEINRNIINADALYLTPEDIERYDVIFHAAAIARSGWPDEDELYRENYGVVHNLIEAWKRTDRHTKIVFASSCVVSDPSMSYYAMTKAKAESLIIQHGHMALRYSNVYGKNQIQKGPSPNVIAAMLKSRRENGYVTVDGDGSQQRDFVNVFDIARATIKAIHDPVFGIWDVASGQQISIIDIARKMNCPIKYGPSRNDPKILPQNYKPFQQRYKWYPDVDHEIGMFYLHEPKRLEFPAPPDLHAPEIKETCTCSDNHGDIWTCPIHKEEHAQKFVAKYTKSHCCFAGCQLLACGHCVREFCFCHWQVPTFSKSSEDLDCSKAIYKDEPMVPPADCVCSNTHQDYYVCPQHGPQGYRERDCGI